jgi:hypothetical protein
MVGTQSGTPMVGTQTGEPEPTDDGAPMIGDTADGSTGGDIPNPDTDPAGYAAYLEKQQNDYGDLTALLDQLQPLVEAQDPKAIALSGKIQSMLNNMGLGNDYDVGKAQELWDQYADYMPNGDFDGDGITNRLDVDADGDGVTKEGETALGSSDYSIDSDGDGITDMGEGILKDKGYWAGAADNPDANHNGILDGKELPSSIAFDGQGNSIIVGGSPRSGDSGGTGGTGGTTGTASSNIVWGSTPSDSQSATWGDTVDASAHPVNVTFNNENIEFSTSANGEDLIITNEDNPTQMITIKNYKDGRLDFLGTSGNVTTNNFDMGNLAGKDTDGDGFGDKGAHFADGIKTSSIQNNYDPFGGSMPKPTQNGDVTEYTIPSPPPSGTFTVPSQVNGQDVTSISVHEEGSDVIIELKGSPDGPTLKTFKLIGGKAAVEAAASGTGGISFQLDDKGQYFNTEDTKCHVIGGKGDDYVTAMSGSFIEGGDGSDVLRAVGDNTGTVIDGGAGDDYIEGNKGGGATLRGGEKEGNDLILAHGDNNTLQGGDGDDILVATNPQDSSANAATHNVVDGGDGNDMTNVYTDNPSNTEVNVSLSSFLKYLQDQKDQASGELLKQLTSAGDLTAQGQEAAAEAIANATMSLFGNKKTERYNSYGGNHDTSSDSSETDVPPPPPTGP